MPIRTNRVQRTNTSTFIALAALTLMLTSAVPTASAATRGTAAAQHKSAPSKVASAKASLTKQSSNLASAPRSGSTTTATAPSQPTTTTQAGTVQNTGTTSSTATQPTTTQPTTTRPTATQAAATVQGLRVMNYQPFDHAWSGMWTNWQPAQMDADLGRIAALGANAVRVSTFPDTFGYPTPNPAYQTRFDDLLNLASKHNLRVQLTAFDWFTRYTQITDSTTWFTNMFSRYANDSRIAIVEFANEVDPTNTAMIAWSKSMIALSHKVLPAALTTVSVRDNPANLATITKQLAPAGMDVADIHFYGEPEAAYTFFRDSIAAAAGLPLFIGETGYSLAGSGLATDVAEDSQARYLDSVIRAANANNIAKPAVWTLNDFTSTAVSFTMPAFEYTFGLYRTDMTARPSMPVVRGWYTSNSSAFDNNGNFTTRTADGMPRQWMANFANYGVIKGDATVGRTAAGSLLLSQTQARSDGAAMAGQQVTMPITAGQKWQATAYAKGTAATGRTTLCLAWYTTSGGYLSSVEAKPVTTGTSAWTQYTVTGTAPANAGSLQIVLKSAGNSGSVWFDDVTWKQL